MNTLTNIAERAASTFLFTFSAAAPTVIVAFDTSTVHTVEVAAIAAGLATVQSVIKNTLAYFTAQGNGPDPADVAPLEGGVYASPEDPGVIPPAAS